MRTRFRYSTTYLPWLLLILPILLVGGGFTGCKSGDEGVSLLVPEELHPVVLDLFPMENETGETLLATVSSYGEDAPLSSLVDDADIVVTWWSGEITDSYQAGEISAVPVQTGGSGEAWPSALMSFFQAGPESADPIALPLSIDPWIMIWNRSHLGEDGEPPRVWENIAADNGPVFGVPGSNRDARLAWTTLLADAYPSQGEPDSSAAFSGGLRKFAGAQAQGLFQRAAFSYPWSDVLIALQRGEVQAVFAPLSRFRSLDAGAQTDLAVRRPPDAVGRTNFPLFADVLIAAVRERSLEKPGVTEVIQALAEAQNQRRLADGLGTIPARLDAPVRDGAAYTAVRIARTAGYYRPFPDTFLSAEETAGLAEVTLLLLKSPANADEILAEHGM